MVWLQRGRESLSNVSSSAEAFEGWLLMKRTLNVLNKRASTLLVYLCIWEYKGDVYWRFEQSNFIYLPEEWIKVWKKVWFLQPTACITWLICLFAGGRNKINWSSIKSSANSCLFSYPAVTQQHDYSGGVVFVSPDGYSLSFSSFFGLLHLMRGIKEMMVFRRTCIMFLFMDIYPLLLSFVAAGSDNSAANTACFILSPKMNLNFSLPLRLQNSG